MEAALLSLTAFCLFGVQADVEVDPNFDLKRFAGKWHVLALASTEPMLQSLKDIITTPAARIVALPNGNLEIETYYLLGETCEGMKGTYMKTEQPGHFTSSDEKGEKDLWVLASDANFAIIYVQREMKGMPPSRSLQFYNKCFQQIGDNAGHWEGKGCPSAIKATDLQEQLLQGLAATKHLGRMRLLWLAALGIAFLCLPAEASGGSTNVPMGRWASLARSPGCLTKLCPQLLGQWYVHAIGSNCEWMVQFLVKEIVTCNVTSTEEGSFTVSTNFNTEYGPMEVDMTFTKQDNGMYLQKSEWGDKILVKRKTDCRTYAMTCIIDVIENDGKICKFVSLYGRTMSVPDSVKQSFVDFATEFQIDREQIFFLAKKDAATKSD
ncbi:hypothetical protein E2320_006567 [Naja naja]|nr:hypothetical protein E2320_006567 [Naja naja]